MDSGKNIAKNNSCPLGLHVLQKNGKASFWHEETRSLLIFYVEDFKLAAKHGEHDALWVSIRAVIDMDPETLDGRVFGCSHERVTTTAQYVHTILGNHPTYDPRPKQGVWAGGGLEWVGGCGGGRVGGVGG